MAGCAQADACVVLRTDKRETISETIFTASEPGGRAAALCIRTRVSRSLMMRSLGTFIGDEND